MCGAPINVRLAEDQKWLSKMYYIMTSATSMAFGRGAKVDNDGDDGDNKDDDDDNKDIGDIARPKFKAPTEASQSIRRSQST